MGRVVSLRERPLTLDEEEKNRLSEVPMAQGKRQGELEELRNELGLWKRLLAATILAKGRDHGNGVYGIRISAQAMDAIDAHSELHDIPATSANGEVRYVFFSRNPGTHERCIELAETEARAND